MHQLITLLVIFIVVWLVIIVFNVNYYNNNSKKYLVSFSAGTAFTLWVLLVIIYASLVLFFTKPCRMNGPVILMILIVAAVTLQFMEMVYFAKERSHCEKLSKKSKGHSKKKHHC